MRGVAAAAVFVRALELDLAWFFGAARLAERPRLFGGGARPAASRLDAVDATAWPSVNSAVAPRLSKNGNSERLGSIRNRGSVNNEDGGQTVAARKLRRAGAYSLQAVPNSVGPANPFPARHFWSKHRPRGPALTPPASSAKAALLAERASPFLGNAP